MKEIVDRPVLLFSRFGPAPDGPHGGCHRSHQIWWDCAQALGEANLQVITYAPRRPWGHRHRWPIRSLMLRQNPLSALAASKVAWDFARSVRFSEPLRQYEEYLREHGAPALCIVEDAVWFHGIVLANRRLGVPTWACPHNLESLDLEGPLRLEHRLGTWGRFGNLANELVTLAACGARFAISRVEAGFLGGVGLETEFYPYRPVGEIRDYFVKIRAARASGAVEPRLLALVGSATHAPTREGMEWFLGNVRAHGLPVGTRIEVVGQGTETLRGAEALAPHGVARGWVDPDSLASLLARAHVVVIPHFSGFGALTRLAELPLAGVPVLVASHAAHAVETLPGVERLPRQWHRWALALDDLFAREPGQCPEPAFDENSVLRQALAAEFGRRRHAAEAP